MLHNAHLQGDRVKKRRETPTELRQIFLRNDGCCYAKKKCLYLPKNTMRLARATFLHFNQPRSFITAMVGMWSTMPCAMMY